jgi:1-acyl-sn-glycerol-3-phosphate acyltransferase
MSATMNSGLSSANPSSTAPRHTISRLDRLRKIFSHTIRSTQALRVPGVTHVDALRIGERWGQDVLKIAFKEVEVLGQPFTSEPCLYVANHVSYLDIPLLMAYLPVTFISKKEVSTWPVFGAAATAYGTVYLDRGSARSRFAVAKTIGEAISKGGKSIGIFPEGTSSMEVQTWKRGAFSIAKEYGFKVQAIRIHYDPIRTAAFVGNDSLMPHLWNMLGEKNLTASVEFFDPIAMDDLDHDAQMLERKVRESFLRKTGRSTAESRSSDL